MPERIQMTRQKPWRAEHPDAVIVARPTKWGNPFRVGGLSTTREAAVQAYRDMIAEAPHMWADLIQSELAGRDLACWCPLDQPCHADVLLEIANQGLREAIV